jgi:hypothetical protein
MEQMGIAPIGAEAAEDVFTEFRVVGPDDGVSHDAEHAGSDPADAAEPREEERPAVEVHRVRTAPVPDPDPTPGHAHGEPIVQSAPVPQAPRLPDRVPVSAEQLHLLDAAPESPDQALAGETRDAHEFSARLADAGRFYDDDYRGTLRSIACEIVDASGPMTFKHLCDRIARLHGFQRTGSEIKRIVRTAMQGARARSQDGGDDEVFWPEGLPVADWIAYRGLEVNGQVRSWQEIPFPERLGLARETLLQHHPEPDLAMGRALGLSRLRTRTRWELNDLLARARESLKREADGAAADANVTYIRQQTG